MKTTTKRQQKQAAGAASEPCAFHIVARGAADPAQVQAEVNKAVTAAMPHVLAAARRPTKAEYPAYPVIVGGETYRLCLEFDALAEAETAIRREGHAINLITAFGSGFTLAGTRTLFAAGLRHFHPEISYARACELLDFPHAMMVAATIAKVLTKDLPEPLPEATADAGV